MDLKYYPSLAELIDRVCILTQKEANVFTYKEKEVFRTELADVLHDIYEHGYDGRMIQAIVVLAQSNAVIWYNEDAARTEAEQNPAMLYKTHRLNADRSSAKARISNLIGGRVDPKLNYLPGLWNIKWD